MAVCGFGWLVLIPLVGAALLPTLTLDHPIFTESLRRIRGWLEPTGLLAGLTPLEQEVVELQQQDLIQGQEIMVEMVEQEVQI